MSIEPFAYQPRCPACNKEVERAYDGAPRCCTGGLFCGRRYAHLHWKCKRFYGGCGLRFVTETKESAESVRRLFA